MLRRPPYTWDYLETLHYYEAFCRAHTRYEDANETLAAAAAIRPGMRVLDFAAGSGGTAVAISSKAAGIRLTCVEPSSLMLAAGRCRVRDAEWLLGLPEGRLFDRIVCGAAIWQMLPIEATLTRLDELLAPGGILAFNIPASYLGDPDPPGGGADPYLTGMLAQIAPPTIDHEESTISFQHEMLAALERLHLRAHHFQARQRLTQAAYRDWLKIPLLTNRLFPDLDANERAARLDEAFVHSDPESWRWETWSGWVCEKDPGYLLVRNAADPAALAEVRQQAQAICAREGWSTGDSPAVGALDPAILRVQAELQSHPAFAALRESPKLLAALREVMDRAEEIRTQQGDVWRIVFPSRPDLTTPEHCDGAYFQDGREFWTAWIPLSDCPLELGPLALRNRFGEWIPQPMRAGDALLFHSTTVHKALENRSGGQLRLSVDLRYA